MNRHIACSAFVALALSLPALAFAEGNDRDNRRDDHAQNERGAGPHHAYHKGDRLPAEERRNEYVVNDWHSRNLREPPAGHHWVRSGDDYVLAAIATGVIADIALNH
jgi:Ni/Co efflux regulator RcnB